MHYINPVYIHYCSSGESTVVLLYKYVEIAFRTFISCADFCNATRKPRFIIARKKCKKYVCFLISLLLIKIISYVTRRWQFWIKFPTLACSVVVEDNVYYMTSKKENVGMIRWLRKWKIRYFRSFATCGFFIGY